MTDVISAELFSRAVAVASVAHEAQVDKAGMPYILHPLRVGLAGKSDAEKVTGFLHDVVEDSRYTLGHLWTLEFPAEVIRAVDALTKRVGEDYWAYMGRVKANDLARAVKLNDLDDNLREDRWVALSQSMHVRYVKARKFLREE